MKDMSVLEMIMTVLSFILTVALPVGIKAYIQIKGAKLEDEERKRLEFIVRQGVAAAEEMGNREGWTGSQKLAFVQETVRGAFPDADHEYLDIAIHAALAISDFNSAVNKKKASKTTKRKTEK